MKPILLVLLLMISNLSNAQVGVSFKTVTFDKPNPSFLNSLSLDNTHHSNSWQIGKPHKIVFDSAHHSNIAIVTDTLNNCAANDTSIFTISFMGGGLSVEFVGLSFYYKLDTDTSCSAKVEALGPGNYWHNLTDTPYLYHQLDSFQYIPAYGKLDTPDLHMSTNEWKLVTLNTYLHSLSTFRFTFITGSNTQNKEGWMIDDISGIYLAGVSVPEQYISKYSCYPNPSKGQFTITAKSAEKVDVHVMDVLGRRVYNTILHPKNSSIDNTIDLEGVPNGLYYIRLKTKDEMETIKLVVEH